MSRNLAFTLYYFLLHSPYSSFANFPNHLLCSIVFPKNHVLLLVAVPRSSPLTWNYSFIFHCLSWITLTFSENTVHCTFKKKFFSSLNWLCFLMIQFRLCLFFFFFARGVSFIPPTLSLLFPLLYSTFSLEDGRSYPIQPLSLSINSIREKRK